MQLTRSELDEELVNEQEEPTPPLKQEEVVPSFGVEHSHLVNSQFLDIDVKPACYNEEIETDEDLDEL